MNRRNVTGAVYPIPCVRAVAAVYGLENILDDKSAIIGALLKFYKDLTA